MSGPSVQERARAIAARLIRGAARVDLETDLDEDVSAELRALADRLEPPRGCELLQWPNEWGCCDPRCRDSTWDHDCPTPPCDIPAHGHRRPEISRMARDLAVGLLHSHPDVNDPMGALAAELRHVADQMQYRPDELTREAERDAPAKPAPRPLAEVMDEIVVAVARRPRLQLHVAPDEVVLAAGRLAQLRLANDVTALPDPAIPPGQAVLADLGDCTDCPDQPDAPEGTPGPAGRGADLWYVKHTHHIAGGTEDAVHSHHIAQHHSGDWTNPFHEGVAVIAWAELRLQLAADLAAEEAGPT